MSEPTNPTQPPQPAPRCPQCGQPLIRRGQVKNVGTHKKWVDEWHCETHGVIAIEPKEPK